MFRYFIELCYDGTAYHGWQIQPSDISVQEVLTKALSTLLQAETPIVGAGRTDTGVHARFMAAHFEVEQPVDCKQLAYKLNRILPNDIAVYRVCRVKEDAHARFSALSRTYHYYIHQSKSPFDRQYSWRLVERPLDYEKMNQAAKVLFEYRDFTSFSKLHTDVKTNNCKIMQAEWKQLDETHWMFVIQADRFLRNMVRAVVGTLIEVGRGKLTIEGFRKIIEQKDRCSAGMSVPAHALFLQNVEYPQDIYIEEEICG